MSRYFDMQGNPMSFKDWVAAFEASNRTIARTEVGERYVSTVWMGLDHSFSEGPPLIFETMVFPECELCERYSTLEEAKEGHARMVAQLEAVKP